MFAWFKQFVFTRFGVRKFSGTQSIGSAVERQLVFAFAANTTAYGQMGYDGKRLWSKPPQTMLVKEKLKW